MTSTRRAARAASVGSLAGSLAVPADLLPITAKERRVNAIIAARRLEERGEKWTPAAAALRSDEVEERAALLGEWLADQGVSSKDYTTRNAAIRAGSKLKLAERQASHSAPSPRLRKR